MYVCMCICVYVCVYIYIYIHTCERSPRSLRRSARAATWTGRWRRRTETCISLSLYIYIYTYSYLYLSLYIYIYIYRYRHTYICVYCIYIYIYSIFIVNVICVYAISGRAKVAVGFSKGQGLEVRQRYQKVKQTMMFQLKVWNYHGGGFGNYCCRLLWSPTPTFTNPTLCPARHFLSRPLKRRPLFFSPVLGFRLISVLRIWVSQKHNLNSEGWNSHVHGNSMEILNQRILVRRFLVGRLGVTFSRVSDIHWTRVDVMTEQEQRSLPKLDPWLRFVVYHILLY